jgi:hypothetical protein
MTYGELAVQAAYAKHCRETGSRVAWADLPLPMREMFEAGHRHADAPVFLTWDTSPPGKPFTRADSFNLKHVGDVQWVTSGDGMNGYLQLNVRGCHQLYCIPFDHPDCAKFAYAFGYGERMARWPQDKAEAEKRLRAERAAQKAEADRVARENALKRAKAMGFGPLLAPDVARNA